MKILTFVSSISLSTGGPSRSVPMLVRGLAELGLDVTLMTLWSPDMNADALKGSNARLKVFDRDSKPCVFEQFILNEGFGLIHLQSIWEMSYHHIATIARRHGIPYVVSPRGMLEPWSLSQKRWKKKLALWLYQKRDLDQSACILATAEMEATHVLELGIKAPVRVIPNGIDCSLYQTRTSHEEVKNQVLFLSRIHEKKGIEVLIQAWKRLSPEMPQWRLLIVGNGEPSYIASLRELIRDGQLPIELLEPVYGQEKLQLYSQSALFCLPSYSENFGMVVAEAMACGVPVITTRNCPWEVLNSTHTGWCIDLSVDSLEETLRQAMSMDAMTRFNIGQRASSLVRERFDYRSIASEMYSLYQSILLP